MTCEQRHETCLEDRIQDVHAERPLVVGLLLLLPLLCLGVKEVLSPELGHQLSYVNLELLGVHFSELLERERPSVQTASKSYASFAGVDLQKTGKKPFRIRNR